MYKRGDAFQTKTKRFFAKYNIFFLEKGKEKVVVITTGEPALKSRVRDSTTHPQKVKSFRFPLSS